MLPLNARSTCVALLAIIAFRTCVVAQLVPAPTILNVAGWGGRPGTTVDVTINGAQLNQASELRIEGGMEAQIVTATPGAITAKVTIPPNTPVGLYEMRVVTPGGASTPGSLHFHVSDFPTFVETEPNNSIAQHNTLPELPVTVNGAVNGAEDRDFYHFEAKRGQHLVLEGFAERLVRPAGTTPLNLQLTLYDCNGKRLARGVEREPGHSDPVLEYDIPADDHYLLEVRDEFYRGAGVFFYRLNVGFQPVIDHALPTVVARGGSAEVTVLGRNLAGVQAAIVSEAQYVPPLVSARALSPQGLSAQFVRATPTAVTLNVTATADAPLGARDLRVTGPHGTSNALKFIVLEGAAAPVATTNIDKNNAARLTLPFAQTQQRSKKSDPAYFVFKAKQGERWILEVYGRRLATTMDPFLTLYDANGKELAAVDDSIGADPRVDFNVTQPGENDYTLRVHDVATSPLAPDSTFVVAARKFQPDFAVTATPDNPNLVRGGNVVNVQLTPARIDGYNGPIEIVAEGLPPGVTFTPDKITGAAVAVQFKAAADAPLGMTKVTLRGKATINNETLVHDLVVLSPYQYGNMQVSRPTNGLYVTVVEPFSFALTTATPQLMVTQGANVQTQLKVTRNGNFPGNITLAYAGMPAGMTIQPAATGDNNLVVNLTIATNATTPVGSHNVTITGTSNVNGKNEQKVAMIAVLVAAKP